MYIFGGKYSSRHVEHLNKVFYFDTTTDQWKCPTVLGPKPKNGRNHTACMIINCFFFLMCCFIFTRFDFS